MEARKCGGTKLGGRTETPSMMEPQKNRDSIPPYTSIAEKNIFSPERKEFSITPLGDQPKPRIRPQVILYGVTITPDYQSASVVNPGRPLYKGERETMTRKLGDSLGEYKIAKILSDRITLEASGDTFEVLLYDPQMPKKRAALKTEGGPVAVSSPPSIPASAPGEASPPAPPKESAERPKELIQERPVTPPAYQPATPYTRPSFPPPDFRRSRRPAYPPSRPLIQEPVGN